MSHESYPLQVNGVVHQVQDSWVGESLLYVLRERLGLTGAKGACEQGECGSCTVYLDGDAVCSCLVLAASAQDRRIATIEAIGQDGELSDVQRAFIDKGAVQCGFCTPGLVMTIHHLLDANAEPSTFEIQEALSGNICRCTGYGRIIDAVQTVVARRNGAVDG